MGLLELSAPIPTDEVPQVQLADLQEFVSSNQRNQNLSMERDVQENIS